MLLFWILGAYVLTRSPRSAISLTAVAAQFSTALYLLGQGMVANAATLQEWLPWARNLTWAPHLAPLLWYWLTLLLLREQGNGSTAAYLRFVGYPLAALHVAGTLFFAAAIYVDDALHRWSAVVPAPAGQYAPFQLPDGPLFLGFVLLLAVSTLMSFVNVWMAGRAAPTRERRRCFRWLLFSAVLFFAGANGLGLFNWVSGGLMPAWMGHAMLAAAMVVMAWNVAAYSLLFKGEVVRTDFFYMLTALILVCGLYAAVLTLSGASYSFQLLNILAITLSVVVLSHALIDLARRVLDRVFFRDDVQQLRWNLTTLFQRAARTDDFDALLAEARDEIDGVSVERRVKLTEQALRRLNNPAALGRTELAERIPTTLDGATRETMGRGLQDVTPLERAQALRSVLVSGIERLKPIDDDVGPESPAALQYNILREEYLQGLLNKQIMVRHSISEGTFNRNRRQAIAMLAEEIERQEQLLVRDRAAAFGGSGARTGG
jgi:hypothetical protein